MGRLGVETFLCGNGDGNSFVLKCTEEIRRLKNYGGSLYLRVSASNKRAVRAYQKAGFVITEKIQDGVSYTNNMEDFWVMEQAVSAG